MTGPPLNEQVALVTGASQGIGTEIVRGLAARGVRTYATAPDGAEAVATAETLTADTGGIVIGRAFELTDARSAASLVGGIESEAERLDILVNNAAIDVDKGVIALDADLEVAERTLATNLLGTWRLTQAVVPGMRRRGFGRVVIVSSAIASFAWMSDAEMNWPGDDSYKISKAALNALTVLIAGSLAETGILVNAADPGFCRTGLGAPDAPLSAAEGAEVSIFLATLPDDGPQGQFVSGRETIAW
jgi:NAD(P)-dependent dehydrogenase (short-subunit alcohol dehydrogenase family)